MIHNYLFTIVCGVFILLEEETEELFELIYIGIIDLDTKGVSQNV
jgi:hypothetical protein